jgi:hypothetical protein
MIKENIEDVTKFIVLRLQDQSVRAHTSIDINYYISLL